ncbi:DUF7120 family protein [Natronocalculus amylovorans]|uniref:CopG family transcriptional regulator n=1 Tax=Natronocalculus amylovorans TaxID=2917812 RepID=A0AAE3FWU1_9EURY|nr:CopG family transcriptional regulator [Natronocalculus amylovorans]MCL9816818.1 CopG family transcriptional regulator [Natronocalculus amylovorans]NUE01259.1 CopG family transcriptional regulator [Halorubraceae archaeon YAN]
MATFEIPISDRIDSEIDRLVHQGEFLNREQAIEELLTMGVSTYSTPNETEDGLDDGLFSQVTDDQQDPARRDDLNDGYSF